MTDKKPEIPKGLSVIEDQLLGIEDLHEQIKKQSALAAKTLADQIILLIKNDSLRKLLLLPIAQSRQEREALVPEKSVILELMEFVVADALSNSSSVGRNNTGLFPSLDENYLKHIGFDYLSVGGNPVFHGRELSLFNETDGFLFTRYSDVRGLPGFMKIGFFCDTENDFIAKTILKNMDS